MWNTGICIVAFTSFCFTAHSSLPLNNFISRFSQRINANGTSVHDDQNKTIVKFKHNNGYQHKRIGGNYFCKNNNKPKQAQNKKSLRNNVSSYEQLVIIKKYPYLDLQEMQRGYRPSIHKNARQSVNVESPANVEVESDVRCDPIEDIVNVEIVNRGLTGFAIPPKKSDHIKEKSLKTSCKDSIQKK